MKLIRTLQYRIWLFFGGARTERGFKFLSDQSLKNRKLIYGLKDDLRKIESRVWELEGHTPEESLSRVATMIDNWTKQYDELKEQVNDKD